MPRVFLVVLALSAFIAAPFAAAQKEPPPPKPETYICPDSVAAHAVDCFLNAVDHLYTMCRQVKSIEIIEFGYEKSEQGVNCAKSGYCVDKHKASITQPYQAALHEAGGNRPAADGLHGLHDLWLKSLQDLKWHPGETDEQYKKRTALPYEAFHERATAVRTALASTNKAKPASPAKPAAPPKAAKGKTAGASDKSKGTN